VGARKAREVIGAVVETLWRSGVGDIWSSVMRGGMVTENVRLVVDVRVFQPHIL
jgi:hypothetical protein